MERAEKQAREVRAEKLERQETKAVVVRLEREMGAASLAEKLEAAPIEG